MHFLIVTTLASILVSAADQASTQPVEKTIPIRAGHDIAPLPGGKVAPISQSDKDNVNNTIDYFEKKLKPSRRKKAAPKNAEYPAAASTPTSK